MDTELAKPVQRQLAGSGWAKDGTWAIPLALALALRFGLSLWLGIVWAVVDPYIARAPQLLLFWFGKETLYNNLAGRMFLDVWRRWDAISYLNIASYGYGGVPAGHLNYFPLYPICVRIVSWLTLGETTLAGLLVSTISTFLAFVLIRQYIVEVFKDFELANWTVLVLAIYPTSIYLFAPFSDALFICLAIGCLWQLRRRSWLCSGLLALLAGLARAQGLLLVAVIAYAAWREFRTTRRVPLQLLLAGLVSPLGWLAFSAWRSYQQVPGFLVSFAAYSGIRFADPFSGMIRAFQQAFNPFDPLVFSEVASLLIFTGVFGWFLAQSRFRQHGDLVIYSAANLSLFLTKQSFTASVYQSANRYVLSLFPLFIGIASLVLRLPQRGRRIYVFINVIGLLIVSALYVLFFFVG